MYGGYIERNEPEIILVLAGDILLDQLLITIEQHNVTHCKLSDCNLSDEDVGVIAESLKTNATLVSLSLSRNKIGFGGAESIAEMLKINTTLVSLNLSNNDIKVQGAKVIAPALIKNTTLVSLNLSDNDIDQGVEEISSALEKNKTLAHLDLSNNNISGAGIKVLANALEKNTTLTYLNLYVNDLQDEVANLLSKNKGLTCLKLYDAGVKDENVIKIFNALKNNETLAHLELNNWPLSDQEATILLRALENNNSVIYLGVEYSDISDESVINKITLITERNKKNLTNIANIFLQNKDFILAGKIAEICDPSKKEYSNLRIAIKKSLLIPPHLIKQLLMGNIEDIKIYQPTIEVEDANKICKIIDNFLNYNLFNFAGVSKKNGFIISAEIQKEVSSSMTREEKCNLLNKKNIDTQVVEEQDDIISIQNPDSQSFEIVGSDSQYYSDFTE